MCPRNAEIWITAPLSYSLITANLIELEKSLLTRCQILGLLVNTLAADEKYFVLNRDNLAIPVQLQLSLTKKKLFLNFLLHFRNLD